MAHKIFHHEKPGEATEWEDALVKHNVISEAPKEDYERYLAESFAAENAPSEQEVVRHMIAHSSLEQLNQMEEDFRRGDEEEEDFFEKYRRQRRQEMQNAKARARYGSVEWISRAEYQDATSGRVPEDVWVVCLMYKAGITASDVLEARLDDLASKFPEVKFVKIISTDCVENFPDKQVPTVLLYHGGTLQTTISTHEPWGSKAPTTDDVEWVLAQHGVLHTDLEECPFRSRDGGIHISRR